MIVSPEKALNGMTEKHHLKQCLTFSNTVKPQLSYHVNLVSEVLKPRKLGRNKHMHLQASKKLIKNSQGWTRQKMPHTWKVILISAPTKANGVKLIAFLGSKPMGVKWETWIKFCTFFLPSPVEPMILLLRFLLVPFEIQATARRHLLF